MASSIIRWAQVRSRRSIRSILPWALSKSCSPDGHRESNAPPDAGPNAPEPGAIGSAGWFGRRRLYRGFCAVDEGGHLAVRKLVARLDFALFKLVFAHPPAGVQFDAYQQSRANLLLYQ